MERTSPPPGAPSTPRPAATSWFARAWSGFRILPVWGQVLVWVVVWPLLAALFLVSSSRPAAWRIAGAVALSLVVAPVWAVALTTGGQDGDPADLAIDDEPPEPEPQSEPPVAGADPAPDAGPEPEAVPEPGAPVTTTAVNGELEVHFFDVGQGDATLLLHDEAAILIDTGPWQSSTLVPLLDARGVDALDLVVITHPHADHIGQFDAVMDAYPVDEVWWSGSVTTSQTFERAVTALERSDAAYEEPRAGDRTTIGPLTIDVVNPPVGVGLSDLHDAGVGMRVTYGDVRFLFTGDAESSTERRMVSDTASLVDADILQLGHHGSQTSTTPTFLSAVDPALAIYSASSGNPYGHPHAEVIDRVRAAGIELYGTDVHGSIVVTTDGDTWSVRTESAGEVAAVPAGTGRSAARSGSGAGGAAATDPVSAESSGGGSSTACTGDQVDINTAGTDELERIHQIGADRAEQIIQLRPFSDVRAMDRISGIGAARLDEIIAQGVACVG
jgi:competence protein ComEC